MAATCTPVHGTYLGFNNHRPPRRLTNRHVHDTGNAWTLHEATRPFAVCTLVRDHQPQQRSQSLGTGFRGFAWSFGVRGETWGSGHAEDNRPLVHFAAHDCRSVSRTVTCRVTRFRLLFVCCVLHTIFLTPLLSSESVFVSETLTLTLDWSLGVSMSLLVPLCRVYHVEYINERR